MKDFEIKNLIKPLLSSMRDFNFFSPLDSISSFIELSQEANNKELGLEV